MTEEVSKLKQDRAKEKARKDARKVKRYGAGATAGISEEKMEAIAKAGPAYLKQQSGRIVGLENEEEIAHQLTVVAYESGGVESLLEFASGASSFDLEYVERMTLEHGTVEDMLRLPLVVPGVDAVDMLEGMLTTDRDLAGTDPKTGTAVEISVSTFVDYVLTSNAQIDVYSLCRLALNLRIPEFTVQLLIMRNTQEYRYGLISSLLGGTAPWDQLARLRMQLPNGTGEDMNTLIKQAGSTIDGVAGDPEVIAVIQNFAQLLFGEVQGNPAGMAYPISILRNDVFRDELERLAEVRFKELEADGSVDRWAEGLLGEGADGEAEE